MWKRKTFLLISVMLFIIIVSSVFLHTSNKWINKELILTEERKSTNRTIAWNVIEELERNHVVKDWNKSEVSKITYRDQWLIPYKEEMNNKLKNHELITVTFNTDMDGLLGPIIVVINPDTNKVVGFYPRY
jgi:hypothetical protein